MTTEGHTLPTRFLLTSSKQRYLRLDGLRSCRHSPILGMGSSSSKGESGINHFHPLPTDRLARTSCGSSCSVISLSMSVRPWQRHCRRLASTTGCYVWWSPSTRMGLAAVFNCVIIGFCYMSLLLSRNCALSSKY